MYKVAQVINCLGREDYSRWVIVSINNCICYLSVKQVNSYL